MLRWLAKLDHLTTASRPAWGWLGELALLTLGVHLAADRLDDLLLTWLGQLSLPWPTPDVPLQLATWTAVVVELHVVLWAAWMLVRSRGDTIVRPRQWLDRVSVHAVLATVAWGPLALVGAWVVAMAVEDFAAPVHAPSAMWLSWFVAGLAAWRLGVSGWVRVTTRAPVPRRRLEGLLAAPTVVLVSGLGVVYGLPIRGLLDWLGGWLG